MDTKIIDRIQKLLALATSDNEHEASAAAAHAARLMLEHKIERAQVDTHNAQETPGAVPVRGSTAPWQRSLIKGIATAHDCWVYVDSRGVKRELHVFGLPSDVQTVLYTYAYLERVVRKVAGGTENTGRGYRNAFKLGMSGRIGARLQEARATHENEIAASSGTAMVLVRADALRVQTAYRALSNGWKKTRPTCSSATGYAAGRTAAESVLLGGGRAALGAGAARLSR